MTRAGGVAGADGPRGAGAVAGAVAVDELRRARLLGAADRVLHIDLDVSARGVFERDRFVLTELVNRKIPTLMLPSGGYSRESYRLLARTVGWTLESNIS